MEAKIRVDDMSCEHCRRNIARALEGVAGLSVFQVDLDNKVVEVETEGDLQAVVDAIREAGYSPVVLSE